MKTRDTFRWPILNAEAEAHLVQHAIDDLSTSDERFDYTALLVHIAALANTGLTEQITEIVTQIATGTVEGRNQSGELINPQRKSKFDANAHFDSPEEFIETAILWVADHIDRERNNGWNDDYIPKATLESVSLAAQ